MGENLSLFTAASRAAGISCTGISIIVSDCYPSCRAVLSEEHVSDQDAIFKDAC